MAGLEEFYPQSRFGAETDDFSRRGGRRPISVPQFETGTIRTHKNP